MRNEQIYRLTPRMVAINLRRQYLLDNNKEVNLFTTIIVNGRAYEFNEKKISYEEVIVIAFGVMDTRPEVAYTVKYSIGKNDKHIDKGSLVQGDKVTVKEGMIFNVSRTDQS